MSSTGNITEGHRLFTEWACSIANEQGKPSCNTMKSVDVLSMSAATRSLLRAGTMYFTTLVERRRHEKILHW
jgi:hypothetical protein